MSSHFIVYSYVVSSPDTVDVQYVHPMSYYLVVPKKATTAKEESHTPLRLYIASSGGKQVLSMNGALFLLFLVLFNVIVSQTSRHRHALLALLHTGTSRASLSVLRAQRTPSWQHRR